MAASRGHEPLRDRPVQDTVRPPETAPTQPEDPAAQRAPSAPSEAALPHALKARMPGPVRTAVIGAGFIADFHLDILKELPETEPVCVVDTNLDRARAAAKRHGIPHAIDELARLKEIGVEVAHVLVPPDLHKRIVDEILDLGIGVFVEKPFVLDSEEGAELEAKARRLGLPLAINHNNLFHPAFTRMMEEVRAGRIGKVEHVQVTLSVPLMQLDAGDFAHWMFRAPRNIIFEQAVHPLCQVHALIGKVRSTTTSLLSTRELHPGQMFHDRWSISAEGEHGTAQVYLAFGQGFTRNTVQVIGSDGSLEVDLFHDTLAGERKTLWLDFWNSFLASRRRGGALRRDGWRVLFYWMRFTLGLGRREDAFFVGMRESVLAFHRSLIEHAAPPVGAGDATEVLRWCEAVAEGIPGESEAPPPVTIPEPGSPRAGEVAVFGAAGFIGRRVVTQLREAGLPVTAIVRRTHALPPEILDHVGGDQTSRVRVVRANLEDEASLGSALQGVHTMLHLATGGGDTWEAVERSMVQGTRAVAIACLENDIKRLVYVSSIAALYTAADGGPGAIEDDEPLDAEPGRRPLYSRGKIAAERALRELSIVHGLPVTIVRPGVVVGQGTPMQHSGFGLWVRDNHCVGWGAGENEIPLVWVDDVADAMVRLTQHEGSDLDGKALNLCARVPLNAREIVDELRSTTGRDLCFHPRSLGLSQTMEIGKWLVKLAGRRPGLEFPSWRDLKARALDRPFSSRTAREVLGWQPVEDKEEFLERAIRIYGDAPGERSS